MDFNRVAELIESKHISRQKHPHADLWIYNYTQRAQFENVWTDETLACRGLIVNAAGEIVARPFRKFFNYDQVEVPVEPFEAFCSSVARRLPFNHCCEVLRSHLRETSERRRFHESVRGEDDCERC